MTVACSVGETPEALRDISVSLDNVGKTEQALGRWEQARGVTGEGHRIALGLSRNLPDHTDYRDLAAHFEGRLDEIEAAARVSEEE